MPSPQTFIAIFEALQNPKGWHFEDGVLRHTNGVCLSVQQSQTSGRNTRFFFLEDSFFIKDRWNDLQNLSFIPTAQAFCERHTLARAALPAPLCAADVLRFLDHSIGPTSWARWRALSHFLAKSYLKDHNTGEWSLLSQKQDRECYGEFVKNDRNDICFYDQTFPLSFALPASGLMMFNAQTSDFDYPTAFPVRQVATAHEALEVETHRPWILEHIGAWVFDQTWQPPS